MDPVPQTGGVWRVRKTDRSDLKPGNSIEITFAPAGLEVHSDHGRVALAIPYANAHWEIWGKASALLELQGTKLELEQLSDTPPRTVAERLVTWRESGHRQEHDPLAGSPPVVVFSYPGRTQADAAQSFATHAATLAGKGYKPVAQSWAEGRPGIGRVLMLGEAAGMLRPKGYLTVTYQRSESLDPPAQSSQPDVIELLRRLGELRTVGVLTEDEFQAKKAELLTRL